MKDTLNQSFIWTVSVWITAEQSGKYGRLAAVMVTDWYLKWLWSSPAAMQTDVFSQLNSKKSLDAGFYQPELMIVNTTRRFIPSFLIQTSTNTFRMLFVNYSRHADWSNLKVKIDQELIIIKHLLHLANVHTFFILVEVQILVYKRLR